MSWQSTNICFDSTTRFVIFVLYNIPSNLWRAGRYTSQLNSIIHRVTELIELSLQPHVHHYLVLANKCRAARRQNLGAFLQIVDVVETEKGEAGICFGKVLFFVSMIDLQQMGRFCSHHSSAAGHCLDH